MANTTLEKSEETLKQFITEQYLATDAGKLETIAHSENLKELLEMGAYVSLDSPVRKAAEQRFELIGDALLAKENDFYLLTRFYAEHYRKIIQFPPIHHKAVARFKTLCAAISDIDQLLAIRKQINSGYTPDTINYIFDILEQRIIEVVAIHENRLSFPFLIKIWKSLGQGLQGREDLAKLMPAAIATEQNIKLLRSYYDQAFSGWNHHKNEASRVISARINAAIIEILPKTSSITNLQWYRKICRQETEKLINQRLVKVATPKLVKLNTVKAIIDYSKLFTIDSSDGAIELDKAFNTRLDQVIPGELKNLFSAQQVYPYFELLLGNSYSFSDPKPVRERFDKLYPKFFKKNRNLTIAVQWYRACEKSKSWESIFAGIVADTTDINILVTAARDYWTKPCHSIINERIVELVSKMTAPDQFFLDSIKSKSFYGNEKVFLEKAIEFAS